MPAIFAARQVVPDNARQLRPQFHADARGFAALPAVALDFSDPHVRIVAPANRARICGIPSRPPGTGSCPRLTSQFSLYIEAAAYSPLGVDRRKSCSDL